MFMSANLVHTTLCLREAHSAHSFEVGPNGSRHNLNPSLLESKPMWILALEFVQERLWHRASFLGCLERCLLTLKGKPQKLCHWWTQHSENRKPNIEALSKQWAWKHGLPLRSECPGPQAALFLIGLIHYCCRRYHRKSSVTALLLLLARG